MERKKDRQQRDRYDGHIYRQTDRQKDRQTDMTDTYIDRQIDIWTERQTCLLTYRLLFKQTN